jgi:hypothetical protein
MVSIRKTRPFAEVGEEVGNRKILAGEQDRSGLDAKLNPYRGYEGILRG